MILSFIVNGPPVPCARARVIPDDRSASGVAGQGAKRKARFRAVTPTKTRRYETHVGVIARAAVSHLSAWRLDAAGYAVTIRVFRAERRGDWDNFAKAITDGMNRAVYLDDRLIRRALVEVDEDPARPRVEVEVEMLESGAPAVKPRRARKAVA